MGRVGHPDLDHQSVLARDEVDLLDIGNRRKGFAQAGGIAVRLRTDEDERDQAAIEAGGVQAHFVAVDDALLFQLAHALEHPGGGHAHLAGHFDIGNPGFLLQDFQDLDADVVHGSPSRS